jgi:Lrp/AsnC family transcriptional regulator for asnA, asnC and gidA
MAFVGVYLDRAKNAEAVRDLKKIPEVLECLHHRKLVYIN